MLVILIGVVTFFNLIVLKIKLEKKRYGDFILDILGLLALSWMFGGTLTGMTVAMVASFLLSIYLYIFPPSLTNALDDL